MAEKIEYFSQLRVWQKAHRLVLEIYRLTKNFPSEEKFSLVQQMRRAAVSVPANIAEGFKKRGVRNKLNFYNISQGSLEELKYYIILAGDLGYLNNQQTLTVQSNDVARTLNALILSIEEKNAD